MRILPKFWELKLENLRICRTVKHCDSIQITTDIKTDI